MGILMEFEEKSKSGRARFFWLGVYRLAVFIVVGLALVFMALLNYVSGHYYGIGSAVALAVLLVLVMRREDAHGS